MSSSSFFIRGFSEAWEMMTKAWTSGMPEYSIVASWRVKMATSLAEIRLPVFPKSGFGFLFTRPGTIPCWRSSALMIISVRPTRSPLSFLPRLSLPSHWKVCISSCVVVAI